MKTMINKKKAALWGIVIVVIDMLVGNLLYLNPVVTGIFKPYEGHPSTKSMEYFGGLSNWLLLTASFGILLTILFIILYLLLYKGLPGTGWKKGLSFGLIIGIIKAVPEAFNQWMLFNYPTILIVTQLVNTLISLIILGIVISVIFHKGKVITMEGE